MTFCSEGDIPGDRDEILYSLVDRCWAEGQCSVTSAEFGIFLFYLEHLLENITVRGQIFLTHFSDLRAPPSSLPPRSIQQPCCPSHCGFGGSSCPCLHPLFVCQASVPCICLLKQTFRVRRKIISLEFLFTTFGLSWWWTTAIQK